MRADGRIEQGDLLRNAISARAWNRAQEAADIVLGTHQKGSGVDFWGAPYIRVYARNSSGVDVPRWGVLEIGGVEVDPGTGPGTPGKAQFEAMPVLVGNKPTSSADSKIMIAVEPIASNAVGRVAVAGVVQCKISGGEGSNVKAKADDVEALEKSPDGPGVILWSNDEWALIRFGGGGGGGLRVGTVSSSWMKGSTRSIDECDEDFSPLDETFDATNYFADVIFTSGTRKVACGKVGQKWILIAAECA
jgi:hypothetical protein